MMQTSSQTLNHIKSNSDNRGRLNTNNTKQLTRSRVEPGPAGGECFTMGGAVAMKAALDLMPVDRQLHSLDS